MTNVFTRKHHRPRSLNLMDYPYHDVKKPLYRPPSPTRASNPQPPGLTIQDIPKQKAYLIWHPRFEKEKRDYPAMIRHMKWVNFGCRHPDRFDNVSGIGKVPNIKYTENTTSREHFANPAVRFPELMVKEPRYIGATWKKAAVGIVPNVVVQGYLPKINS